MGRALGGPLRAVAASHNLPQLHCHIHPLSRLARYMSRIPLENVLQGVVPDCVCRATMCAVGSRLRVGVFVLLAALLIVPPLLAQRVAGRVADSLSGRGLPGARVTLSRDSVAVLTRAADDSGRFDLKAPQPVRYTLRVIAIGYAPYSTPVDGTRTS
jgi:hypothetical protein